MARQGLHFTQLAVARAAAGVRQAGFQVAKVEIEPDGKITVITTTDAPAEPEPSESDSKAKLRAAMKEV